VPRGASKIYRIGTLPCKSGILIHFDNEKNPPNNVNRNETQFESLGVVLVEGVTFLAPCVPFESEGGNGLGGLVT